MKCKTTDQSCAEKGEFPIQTTIQSRDVLLGRRRTCTNHPGTLALRILVALKTNDYIEATRYHGGKTAVIVDVSNDILSTEGRFLKRAERTCQQRSREKIETWYLLNPKEIHEKVAMTFRDAVKVHKNKPFDQFNAFRQFGPIIEYFLSRQAAKESITYSQVLLEILESQSEMQSNSAVDPLSYLELLSLHHQLTNAARNTTAP